jgi:hypothetical protein
LLNALTVTLVVVRVPTPDPSNPKPVTHTRVILYLRRSWAVKCNVVHYSWGALMINQYEGHESKLGGLTVLSYFGE